MKELKYVIKDEMGIHAKKAVLLAKEVEKYPCKVTIQANGFFVKAKSILGIMGLGVRYGQEITLKAEGEQEEETIISLGKFLENNL